VRIVDWQTNDAAFLREVVELGVWRGTIVTICVFKSDKCQVGQVETSMQYIPA
jgi:hypothetical protein